MFHRMTTQRVSINIWLLAALLAASVAVTATMAAGTDLLRGSVANIAAEEPPAARPIAAVEGVASDPADRKFLNAAAQGLSVGGGIAVDPADRKFLNLTEVKAGSGLVCEDLDPAFRTLLPDC